MLHDDKAGDGLLNSSASSASNTDSTDLWEEDEVDSLFEEDGLLIEYFQEEEPVNKVQELNHEEETLGISSLFEEDKHPGGTPSVLCASAGNSDVGLNSMNVAEKPYFGFAFNREWFCLSSFFAPLVLFLCPFFFASFTSSIKLCCSFFKWPK